MTQKSSSALKTEINSSIASNGTGSITGPVLNSVLTDLVDSNFNKTDNPGLFGLNSYSTTQSYAVGNCIVYNGRILQCNSATSGVFNAAKWTLVDNGEVIKRSMIQNQIVITNSTTPALLMTISPVNTSTFPKQIKAFLTGKITNVDTNYCNFEVKADSVTILSLHSDNGAGTDVLIDLWALLTDRLDAGSPPQGIIGYGNLESMTWKKKARSASSHNTTVGTPIVIEVWATWSAANAGNVLTIDQGGFEIGNYQNSSIPS